MKKILLASAAVAAVMTAPAAEAFNGFFAGLKGGMNLYNIGGKGVATLAKAEKSLDDENKAVDLGGFGMNGFNVGVEGGYSYRMSGGLTLGASLGLGYNSFKFGTTKDDAATKNDVKKDAKVTDSTIDLSGFDAQVRARIGYAFSKFQLFIDPGFATTFGTPKLTTSKWDADTAGKLTSKDGVYKDVELKDASFMSKSSFVVALNFQHAITANMYYGIALGARFYLANGENLIAAAPAAPAAAAPAAGAAAKTPASPLGVDNTNDILVADELMKKVQTAGSTPVAAGKALAVVPPVVPNVAGNAPVVPNVAGNAGSTPVATPTPTTTAATVAADPKALINKDNTSAPAGLEVTLTFGASF